ncbi:MAG TPA: tetratricopeptide repeat protein [Pyrinomonadaceae bacterium]|nr:tetratricopeptide repeat protein [Pyrinomonadaceae bacterium]
MKSCPQCKTEYADETLNFCLEDGSSLITALAVGADHLTAILSGGPGEERTLVYSSNGSHETSVGNSIAVLPFVNMSADVDNEYFCDGLAEELLIALAKIDDLKVAARTAAFSFRGKNVPMAEIGRTLNVKTVLEGSVRKAGDRVRITIQLINAEDGYHLWSERYDRDMQDIFEIQDEITLAVVDALKVKLLAPEKRAMLKRHTNDPEAYQLYLRGRYFFYKRTPEGFIKAIECFEKAIERDENYALAVSGLADSYVFQGFYEMISPQDAAAKVGPLVKRAVALDETSSETNTSRALEKTLYEWEHRESLNYFRAAIAADPKYALAYHLESAVSVALGDYESSIAAEKKAIEIDPFTPVFNASLAWWYYIAGRNEEAIEHCKRTIEIAPNHFFAYWILGLAYAIEGSHSDAVVAFQRAVALNQFEAHVRADLARVFAVMGEKEEALAILKEFEEEAATKYVSPVNQAKIYLGLGEDERVIELIQEACEQRAVRLTYLLIDPILNHLKDDPRIQETRRRVGIAV